MAELRDNERPGPTPPPPVAPDGRDPARARFYFIAAHRVIGAVLIVLGMLAMQGALDWGEGIGKVLAIVGLIDFFVIPLVFARMWRSLPK
jgi:hypothetical protein